MSTRLSVSWLNLFFVLGLVAAWLGILDFTKKQVQKEARLTEPREDVIKARHHISELQSDIAQLASEQHNLQAQIHEQQLEQVNAEATRAALLHSYPILQSLGVEFPKAIPEWLTIRPEILHTYARARLEFDTSRSFAAALESDLAELAMRRAEIVKASATNETTYLPGPANVPLDTVVTQISAVEKSLAEARLESARLKAQLETMTAADPRISTIPADANAVFHLPTDVTTDFIALHARHRKAAAQVSMVQKSVDRYSTDVKSMRIELAEKERAALQELQDERDDWEFSQRTQILSRTIWPALVLLLVAVILHMIIFQRSINWPNRLLVYGISLGSMIVIYASEMFGVAGCGIAIVVLLLVGAALVRFLGKVGNTSIGRAGNAA